MKAVLLIIRPGSTFHFGEYTTYDETFLDNTSSYPHSDTIFSALVCTFDKVWPGETERFIDHFRSGRVRISSGMFCFRNSNNSVFFIPRPSNFRFSNEANPKLYKRIEWISTGMLQKLSNESEPEMDPIIVSNNFAVKKYEWEKLSDKKLQNFSAFSVKTVPMVMIHSLTQEDSFYHQSNITIEGDADINVSYYFLLDDEKISDNDHKKLLTTVKLLPDTGIGGQRTTGCGLFEDVMIINNPLPTTEFKGNYVSLGLLSPGNDLDKLLAYRLITRGGRSVERGKLKKAMMISEGALMSGDIPGQILDLSPSGDGSHLRYGMSINWPIDPGLLFI